MEKEIRHLKRRYTSSLLCQMQVRSVIFAWLDISTGDVYQSEAAWAIIVVYQAILLLELNAKQLLSRQDDGHFKISYCNDITLNP